MVGSSIVKQFKSRGYVNLITKTRSQLDLLNQNKTFEFLKKTKPDAVIISAAKVGGIHANNKFRADFLYQNLQIQNNLIHGSFLAGIKKLIFLGSSCIYPRNAKQPIKEKYLLTSPLEYTNEPYAIAKIAGLKMCENYNKQYKTNYICLMPCNLYGPNDNYDLQTSHFLPALLKKIHLAKIKNKKNFLVWGNGKAKRELMYVDDLALACIHFLKIKTNEHLINIGSGEEYTISQFVNKITKFLSYEGNIVYQKNMPNGTPRKIIDSSIAKSYGWSAKIKFIEGLKLTYNNFLKKN